MSGYIIAAEGYERKAVGQDQQQSLTQTQITARIHQLLAALPAVLRT